MWWWILGIVAVILMVWLILWLTRGSPSIAGGVIEGLADIIGSFID